MIKLPRWKDFFGTDNKRENSSLIKPERDKEIDSKVIFSDFFPEQLLQCQVGSKITLWTREHLSNINGYREGTCGGQGKSVELMKADNPGIARCLELGHPVWLTVAERTGSKFEFKVHVDRTQRHVPEEIGEPDETEEPVDIDDIDDLEITVESKVALERVRRIMRES